jgi:DNA ligase-1
MPDILEGQTVEVQGSARLPYVLKNIGGVYSCSCPAWRNQSRGIEARTCKHLRQYRGEQAEAERIGSTMSAPVSASLPTKAPPLLLAQTWTPLCQERGWWMSEKLDGVRAYWDGQRFLSRLGNVYHAPDWFFEQLPATPLDGELWLDRRAFQRTVSIVRRQDKSEQWRKISYVVFDAPTIDGLFEERQAAVAELVARAGVAHVRHLAQERCRDEDHLREELARIESLGGEGLMLRMPRSLYEAGCSVTLLKVKSFHDAEALVISHLPGDGRHLGRLGSLLVALPNGIQFAVGSGFTDAQREQPPAVGSTITFRYQELTDRGVPRFPTFVRVRTDVRPVKQSA